MKSVLLYFVSLLATLSLAVPVQDLKRAAPTDLPRLVIYFQTTHDSQGRPISLLPLINQKGIALTHIIIAAFHINLNSEIHLNDFPPSDPHFATLWNETVTLKNAGVKVLGMVGGAASGSFDSSTLDGDAPTFEKYYGQLHDVIVNFQLQGIDLDVEQSMSQNGITRLVSRLRQDFGGSFLITLAPVASALENGGNLSGFNYKTLETANGPAISWYNAQFYSGFGTMSSPKDFQNIVGNGFKATEVVAGQLTSPANGGGYIPTSQLNSTLTTLRNQYGQIGGVMGWEYFNSNPGGTAQPWQWAQIVTQILRPNGVPNLRITKQDAQRLQKAYDTSVGQSGQQGAAHGSPKSKPSIDYMAMVNA